MQQPPEEKVLQSISPNIICLTGEAKVTTWTCV